MTNNHRLEAPPQVAEVGVEGTNKWLSLLKASLTDGTRQAS